MGYVSIHSPAKKVGRLEKREKQNVMLPRFNPLPSQEGGETQDEKNPYRSFKGFNPLPSQEGGETHSPSTLQRYVDCFNPLPSQEGGETLVFLINELMTLLFQSTPQPRRWGDLPPSGSESPLVGVSIHSPAKKVGRREQTSERVQLGGGFQSTPQPRRWGDLIDATSKKGTWSFQSTPQPRRWGDFQRF